MASSSERHAEHEADAPLVGLRIFRVSQTADVLDVEQLEDVVYARDGLDVGCLGVHRAREILKLAVGLEAAGEVVEAVVVGILRQEGVALKSAIP